MGVLREMGFEDGRLSRLVWEEQVAGQAVEGRGPGVSDVREVRPTWPQLHSSAQY